MICNSTDNNSSLIQLRRPRGRQGEWVQTPSGMGNILHSFLKGMRNEKVSLLRGRGLSSSVDLWKSILLPQTGLVPKTILTIKDTCWRTAKGLCDVRHISNDSLNPVSLSFHLCNYSRHFITIKWILDTAIDVYLAGRHLCCSKCLGWYITNYINSVSFLNQNSIILVLFS